MPARTARRTNGSPRSAFQQLNPVTQVGQFGKRWAEHCPRPGVYSNGISPLSRSFRFTESKNLQFRAEFFNLFNHANFGLPVNDLNSQGFRENPRLRNPVVWVQVALKFLTPESRERGRTTENNTLWEEGPSGCRPLSQPHLPPFNSPNDPSTPKIAHSMDYAFVIFHSHAIVPPMVAAASTLPRSESAARFLPPGTRRFPATPLFSDVCVLLNSLAALFQAPSLCFQCFPHSSTKTPGVWVSLP